MRRIMTVITPLLILLAAWAVGAQVEHASYAILSMIRMLPFILAIVAISMSVWFQNSNLFYLIFFILFSYISMNISVENQTVLLEVITMVSILLPINIIWLAFSKERGIFSSYGRNKAIVILGQIIWIFVNMIGNLKASESISTSEHLITIKIPAIVLFVIAVGIILADYFLNNKYTSLIYVAVLITSLIALCFGSRTYLVAVFTSAVFLIIVGALFELSFNMVYYDALTGVLSRRALEQEMLRLSDRYAIAMVDLDCFKKINDTYGHDAGDEVLKMVANTIAETAGSGKVFRYGGEEFVVLYKGQTYSDIKPQLELMRKAVEQRPFVLRDKDRPSQRPEKIMSTQSKGQGIINITISIGVAQKNELLRTCQDVIRKADEALYKSKNKGRNLISKV